MIRLLVLGALMVTLESVECRPKEEVDNRILGGEEAGIHEFPEALLITVRRANGLESNCTASIINSYWGLTAGHCCADVVDGYVLEGSSDQSQGRIHYINPGHCIAHEEYSSIPINDVAVFKVTTEFSLDGKTNKPIKLPEVDDSLPHTFDATAVGWGYYTWSPASTADILQKIQLTVTETIIYGEKKFLSQANGSITGVCHGDSGGPLYYNGTVVGVASDVLPECNTTDYRGYHTIVSSYRTWIDNTILKYD